MTVREHELEWAASMIHAYLTEERADPVILEAAQRLRDYHRTHPLTEPPPCARCGMETSGAWVHGIRVCGRCAVELVTA